MLLILLFFYCVPRGVVKITPAHDLNDYQAGLRHNLEIIEVFDENFKMGNLVSECKGMELLEARKWIVEKLREIGAFVKEEDYTHNVAKCERCKHTIEPKISTQWFINMKNLAKRAADVVRNGETRFVPKRYEKQYFHWLDNIQDWCISRQLWWGHQIPAYYCKNCGEVHVSKTMPAQCKKCGENKLEQDADTLDTWFSSALWPFSTLGWPNVENRDYQEFYPTNVLVTGFDIITFWISRMMTQGLEFTDIPPFRDVLIHGIVRDSQGRKMSKTLGNGVDPIDVINEYSADALRFSVISGTTMGNDIRYMPEKLEQASNFANKIWNVAKLITANLASDEKIMAFSKQIKDVETKQYKVEALRIEDRWILNKLDHLIKEVTENIENYDLGIALDKIYNFIWNEFCDWYIEMAKARLYSKDEEEKVQVSFVLNYVLGDALKLLHPFMPFITTEIYSKLVNYDDKDLMVSHWPKTKKRVEYDEVKDFIENLKEIIVGIRNVRANRNVHPSKKANLIFVTNYYQKEIEASKEYIAKLGFGNEIVIQNNKQNIPQNAISIVVDEIEVFMPFEDLVDLDEEKERLQKEKERLEKEVERGEKMLSNPGFTSKAPESKIKEEKEKLAKYEEMLQMVVERLKKL